MPSIPKPSSALFPSDGSYSAYHAPGERYTAARLSRCCSPSAPPMRWHCYWLGSHPEVIEVSEWLKSLPISLQESLIGEIEDRLDAAASGTLDPSHPGEPIKSVMSQPDLFELRWTLDPESGPKRELRQYHGEPLDDKTVLVATHIHLKCEESVAETKRRQNASMEQAAYRFCHGTASKWGRKEDSDPIVSPIGSLGF